MLEQIFSLRPLDCKDSARAFPKREVREKPTVILGVSTALFSNNKNILGMMPHPERMIDPSLSGEDGSLFFNNLINNLK